MEPPPEIRPCTAADRAAVLQLAPRLTIGVASWRDRDAVAAAVRGWLDSSTKPDGDAAAYVAIVGGQIVGFVSVSTTVHFAGERDAYIGELVVAEDHEDRGLGRRLAATAEQWAIESGYRCITLSTGAANHRARRFYAGLGYEEEDVKLTKVLRSGDPGAGGPARD